jgi:hypothetical protein
MTKQPMSEKTPELRQAIDAIMEPILGNKPSDMIAQARCPCCTAYLTPFRDKLSKREYEISGMCQACQDKVFGVGEDS